MAGVSSPIVAYRTLLKLAFDLYSSLFSLLLTLLELLHTVSDFILSWRVHLDHSFFRINVILLVGNTSWTLINSSVSLLAIKREFTLKNRLQTVSADQLDVLFGNVLLNHFLYVCIVESCCNIITIHFLHKLGSDHVLQFILHSNQNAPDFSLCDFLSHLKRSFLLFRNSTALSNGILDFLLLLLVELLRLAHFVLVDVLLHNFVVKLQRVLVSQFVVDFASHRFNSVKLFRGCHVCDTVCARLGSVLVVKNRFVSPSSFFLFHKSLCGRRVSLHITLIEFTHHFIEFVHLRIVSGSSWLAGTEATRRLVVQYLFKFSLNLGCFLLQFFVSELMVLRQIGRICKLSLIVNFHLSFYNLLWRRLSSSWKSLLGGLISCNVNWLLIQRFLISNSHWRWVWAVVLVTRGRSICKRLLGLLFFNINLAGSLPVHSLLWRRSTSVKGITKLSLSSFRSLWPRVSIFFHWRRGFSISHCYLIRVFVGSSLVLIRLIIHDFTTWSTCRNFCLLFLLLLANYSRLRRRVKISDNSYWLLFSLRNFRLGSWLGISLRGASNTLGCKFSCSTLFKVNRSFSNGYCVYRNCRFFNLFLYSHLVWLRRFVSLFQMSELLTVSWLFVIIEGSGPFSILILKFLHIRTSWNVHWNRFWLGRIVSFNLRLRVSLGLSHWVYWLSLLPCAVCQFSLQVVYFGLFLLNLRHSLLDLFGWGIEASAASWRSHCFRFSWGRWIPILKRTSCAHWPTCRGQTSFWRRSDNLCLLSFFNCYFESSLFRTLLRLKILADLRLYVTVVFARTTSFVLLSGSTSLNVSNWLAKNLSLLIICDIFFSDSGWATK